MKEQYRACSAAEEKAKGRMAFRVLGRREGMALCRIRLFTGRPHQIRVQFASRGFALYGDARYGRREGSIWLCFRRKSSWNIPQKSPGILKYPRENPFPYLPESLPAYDAPS